MYRGTSLRRNRHPFGPSSRTMPRLLWRSWKGRRFLMSEVLLWGLSQEQRNLPGAVGVLVRQ